MEAEFQPNQHKMQIEYLANKLVYGGKIQNEREIVREIISSGLPVCVEFYRKYIEFIKIGASEESRGMVYHYFCDISRWSNPDFGNEIFEILSSSNDYEIDRHIAANPNPSIGVKLLREIGVKKYPTTIQGIKSVAELESYSKERKKQRSDLFRGSTDYELELSWNENILYRIGKLKSYLSGGYRPSLKWIVKENILKRQQLLLQEFINVFGGEVDPIYKNLDKYDLLKTCDDLAKLIYTPNNSSNEIDPNRRFEETIMDIINPGNKDGIPNLLVQMEVYINGLNPGHKLLFGKPKLLKLCNLLLEGGVFSFSANYTNVDLFEDSSKWLKNQFGMTSISFYCFSKESQADFGWSNDFWSAFQEYIDEIALKNKTTKEVVRESVVGRTNNNSSNSFNFNQSDLNYDNIGLRANSIDRILLSLQKDRNFVRKLLEELLKEPLPTTDDILFAENAELEAQKLADPERQEEIWYKDMEKKIFQEELTGDSKQEEIECGNLVEKLKDDHLEYFWKEYCIEIDKIFAGNKRILILINSDLKSEEGWVRPNWQLRVCWEELKAKYESKSEEEIDYTKYSFVANQLLLRLSRNYETILNGVISGNKELAGLLHLEIMKITKVVESLTIFVD
jgi:hypothetical protein